MTRPIKFRAWHLKENVMDYDLLSLEWNKTCNNWAVIGSVFLPSGQRFNGINGESVLLLEDTGLLDKKGKQIYEGDILKFLEAHEEGCDCQHCWPCKVGDIVGIKWVDDGYILLPMSSYFNGEGDRESYCEACSSPGRLFSPNHEIPIGCVAEIIGNIYDNKELVK